MNPNLSSLLIYTLFDPIDYPILEKIDFKFNKDDDRDKQIKVALMDIERDCSARKIAVEATKEQEDLVRKQRNEELEKTNARLKKKEELQARLKKRQYRRGSNRRVTDPNLKGEVAHTLEFTEVLVDDPLINSGRNRIVERRQRRRKGSDFFDPKSQGDDGVDDDLTPTNPRRLISSFLSQSSGQRVRWADGDVPDDDSHNIIDGNNDGQNVGRDGRKETAPTKLVTSTNTTNKEDRVCSSGHEIGSSDIKKVSALVGRRSRGRQRSRSASKSSRKRNTRQKQPESMEDGTTTSDVTLLKTTGSTSVVASQGQSSSPRSAQKETADSNDTSSSRKYNRKFTDLEIQDKRRRQEDVKKASPGKLNAERKSHLCDRDVMKKKPRKSDVKLSVLENEGNGSGLGIRFSEGGKRKGEKSYSSRWRKETVKQKETQSAVNDQIPLIGKGRNSGDKKMMKPREACKERRNSFTDIDRDTNFLEAENSGSANRDKLAGAERESRRKYRDKSKSIRGEHIEESRKRGSRSDKELSNHGLHDKKGNKSSIAKASSASQGNGNRKKRKVQRDNFSVSSSKVSVTGRRRKKRNIKGSQKSSATNFGDESCDFNFQ